MVALQNDKYVAVDGDHGDAHEGYDDAGEYDLSEHFADFLGNLEGIANKGGRHGHGAQSEVARRQIADVDVRNLV